MECSDLARTGVGGLDRVFVINIDHHPGNTGYGAHQLVRPVAAACGEMVFDVIARARRAAHARDRHAHLPGDPDRHRIVPLLEHLAADLRHLPRSASTPASTRVLVARNVYDSNSMGRLRLFGAVLSAMQIDPTGRIAMVCLDHEMARAAGGTYEDTEGSINLPLTVKEIQAVVFFKQVEGDEYRVSLRSKGDHRRRRRREGVRRRRPQERGRLHGQRRDRALQTTFVEKIEQAIGMQGCGLQELQEGLQKGM